MCIQPYIFLFKSIFSLLDSVVFNIDCIVNSLPYFNTASATSSTPSSHSGKATDHLNRQVIVVPDRDAPGEKLINQAIEFGWSVAFPEWDKTVGDVADAVLKYGRLFTIQSILKTTESSKLKIDLKRKMYG